MSDGAFVSLELGHVVRRDSSIGEDCSSLRSDDVITVCPKGHGDAQAGHLVAELPAGTVNADAGIV